MNELEGKKALVTGGSRGIGAAIARALGAAGADVALTYTSRPDLAEAVVSDLQKLGRNAARLPMNAAEKGETAAIVAQTREVLGGLDIVVLNAGTVRAGPVWELSDEDYDTVMKVNVDQVFYVTREAAKVLPEGGRIVVIGSVNADRMPMPGIGLYGASKAAVAGFVQGWARDLAQKGVTINVVQPGPIDTDLNPDGGPFTDHIKPLTAQKRYGRVEDVAELVRFVCGPQAGYITGARLDVDGGLKS